MSTLPHNQKSILGVGLAALLALVLALAATAASATAQTTATSAWAQPSLVNPVTITLSDTNRTLNLSSFQDYVLQCPPGVVNLAGKITVWGGHNVVFQDCDEYVTNPAGDWAGDFQNQTGTLWIHDVHFGGAHLTGGIQLQEPGSTVVLRDVLFDQVTGSYSTNHAECVQTWSGPARLLIDGLTCSTTYQGLFLLPNQYGGPTPTVWDFRNVDIYGQGAIDYYLGDVGAGQIGRLSDFALQNVYDCDPTSPRTYDGTSDANQAWTGIHGCPTAGGTPFVSATAYGASGPDESSDPVSADPNELGDPLRYQDTVNAATPAEFWRLSEGSGATATDMQNAANGTYLSGVALGAAGPLAGNADTAAVLQTRTAQIQSGHAYTAPNQYTIEAWFTAQPGSGAGQIVGMNQNQNGSAAVDDHSIYLTSSGQVVCYYYSAGKYDLVSPSAYADGRWHLVQCAKGPGGMTLDIDGQKVASNTFTGAPYPYSGYWLIGSRYAGDGARQSFLGSVGQVAIYGYALSQAQDADHWAVGQGQPAAGN